MQRKYAISGGLAAVVAGLAVLVPGAVARPAPAHVGLHAAPAVTVINVTAGKPAELAFKLSKKASLVAGTFTFKVTNMGFATHNFKICTTPVTSTTKNACAGKATPMLKRGESAILTVKLTKTGLYEFLCAVPGHAAAGMKGLLGVGVTVPATAAAASASGSTGSGSTSSGSTGTGSTGSTSTGGGSTGGGGGAPTGPDGCPAGTTIATAGLGADVDEDDTGGPTDGDGCI